MAWWRQVDNKELRNLIDRGLSNNLDIEKAVDCLLIARQNVTIARADGLPQIGAGGTTQSFGASPSDLLSTTSTNSAGDLRPGNWTIFG
ncbi:protein of unknown function [Bradyrhizobium sp. ORS 285]|nr:protein of unknown function [Bradyrhizobium sp. ORS 285]